MSSSALASPPIDQKRSFSGPESGRGFAKKGGRAWRDRRGKVPRPQPRPQGPWVSCLVLSLGLSFGVPADRSKTVLFMPEKWAWPSEKWACQGGIEGARCPTPCHAPPGVLGWRFRSFHAEKSPFFANFRRFSSLVFWLFGAPKVGVAFRGGVAGCPAPRGSSGGSVPGRITGISLDSDA